MSPQPEWAGRNPDPGGSGGGTLTGTIVATPTDPTTTPLQFKPAVGATAAQTDQLEVYADDGTMIGYWDANGNVEMKAADGETRLDFSAGLQQLLFTCPNTTFTINPTGITLAVAAPAVINLFGLPTSDPHVAGNLWNSSGVLHVSAG